MYTILKIAAVCLLFFNTGFTSKLSTPSKNEPGIAAGGNDIRTKTEELVKEKLLTPYQSKVEKKMKREKFSRCPSGYRYNAHELAASEAEYSYGILKDYVGCRPVEICRYRARLSDKSVDILQSDSTNYMAVDLWLNTVTTSKK